MGSHVVIEGEVEADCCGFFGGDLGRERRVIAVMVRLRLVRGSPAQSAEGICGGCRVGGEELLDGHGEVKLVEVGLGLTQVFGVNLTQGLPECRAVGGEGPDHEVVEVDLGNILHFFAS